MHPCTPACLCHARHVVAHCPLHWLTILDEPVHYLAVAEPHACSAVGQVVRHITHALHATGNNNIVVTCKASQEAQQVANLHSL